MIIFDEATKALDGIIEVIIMGAIHESSDQKTIIMVAYRLQNVQKCDVIYMMDKGKIINRGSYQQLVENNQRFKEMAEHA